MKRLIFFIAILSLTVLIASGCRSSRPEVYSLPASYPSVSNPWVSTSNYILESVAFNSSIDVSNYIKIIVLPIDQKDTVFYDKDVDVKTKEAAKKDDEDNKIIINKFMNSIDTFYWKSLSSFAPSLIIPMEKADTTPSGVNVLILKTKAVIVDPGSESLRLWIGFGAGSTKIKLEFDLVDGVTGKVLLKAIGEDRAAGGAFGGKSYDLLESNMEEIVGSQFSILMKSIFKK